MRHHSPSRRRFLRPHRLALSAVPIATAFASAALAEPPSSGGDPLKELLDRVEQLERKNQDLEGEVVRLREADGEGWLTEQRAIEIRGLVQDVLADADTRASLQSSGMTAGWDNGFFLQSADGRFLLQVGGLLQTRYVASWVRTRSPAVGITAIQALWSDDRETRSGFDLPATQIWFQGHLFGRGLTYRLKAGFANDHGVNLSTNNVRPLETGSGQLSLYDAWARVELGAGFFFRAGQFRLPFSREELVERQYQLAVEPSVVSYALGVDYSQGLELAYVSDTIRGQLAFSDGGYDKVGGQLKMAGSMPRNRPFSWGQVEYAFTGRFEFKPYGEWSDFDQFTSAPGGDFGLMFGLGMHVQSWRPDFFYQRTGFNQGDNMWLMATADVSMNFGGASLYGAFTWANTDSEAAYYYAGQNNFNLPPYGDMGTANKWGMVVQGAYYILPKIELFARYELGQLSINNEARVPMVGGTSTLYARENHLNLATVGVNWYIDGQDAKFTADVGYAFNSFGPSWFSGTNGWRVSATRDQLVARAMFQLMF